MVLSFNIVALTSFNCEKSLVKRAVQSVDDGLAANPTV